MIDCESLVDKMPLVAHRQAAWTPEEAAHLSDCAECAASWRVVSSAPRLGEMTAQRLDLPRLTVQLHDRLARDRRARRWKRTGWITGLAAAAVLTIMVWDGTRHRPVAPGTVASASGSGLQVPLAELEGLDGDQLQAVLEALDAPLGATGGGPSPSFGDLDDSQLERVLRSLEG
jgi:hypothetical protein